MTEKDKTPEFWRWAESRQTCAGVDWRNGRIITAGVDVGSVSTQVVVMVDGKLYCYSNMRTGSASAESAKKAMDWALEGTGLSLEKIHLIVGTGYGRVNVPFAARSITEISCHARGATYIYGPKIRTILDMGGQDCKAIRCDKKGKVISFVMNDKCAAGTGRGIEVFADLVGVNISEFGALSLNIEEEPPPVSSTCIVFAKTEAAGLLRQGWSREKVLAAFCSAITRRVVALLESIGIEKEVAITGGIAKNIGIVNRLAKMLDISFMKSNIDPQLAGAIGAALFAKAIFEKKGDG